MSLTPPVTVTIRSETRHGKFVPRDAVDVQTWTHLPNLHCCGCGAKGNVWTGESDDDGTSCHTCTSCLAQWHMHFFKGAKAQEDMVQILKDRLDEESTK